MRNAPGSVVKICLIALILAAPAVAQRWVQNQPPAAATGPAYDMSLGYTYVRMPIPSASSITLNGIDVAGGVDFTRRWGARLDSSYAHTASILGVRHAGYVMTLLGGPVFYPVQRGGTRAFLRALGGVGVVDGAVPISATSYFHGWQSRFSYALGGGIERSLVGPFAVRVGGDYLRTAFYNGAGVVQPQNNVRLTVGFVYQFNARQRRAVLR